MQPLVVAALSVVWLRERPTAMQWMGIGIAMVGAATVALPDLIESGSLSFRGRAALGDGLALVGAFTAATYYVIGRRLRATLDLWAYVGLVYGACLAVLLILAVALDVPLQGYAPRELGIFALLALGPMLLGHTGLNWALRHMRAYQVNIVLLGEPIGATLLAAAMPGIRETPGALTVLGGILVLAGIVLAERGRAG
jgi:drug/metabolite transporter (DMT)-like permease